MFIRIRLKQIQLIATKNTPMYIGSCALIFELFLSCGIATITIGSITTESMKSNVEIQILVGVICGLVESKIEIDIYKKANSVLKIEEDGE